MGMMTTKRAAFGVSNGHFPSLLAPVARLRAAFQGGLGGTSGSLWGLTGGFSEASWRQIPMNMNSRGFLQKFGSGLGG